MFSRITFAAAAGLLAAACATSTASAPSGPGAGSEPSAAPAPSVPSGAVTIANFASSSWWYAEEKLIPDDPVLALVADGARDTDVNNGISAKCNASNGNISMRIGKQAASRGGQAATFKVRAGAGMRDVNGKYEARGGQVEFVFPISSADLMALNQQDMVSFVSDAGEVEWALVKDPAAQVQAKYVGSLKGFAKAASDFMSYCNPK
jgi:hypothetical protein